MCLSAPHSPSWPAQGSAPCCPRAADPGGSEPEGRQVPGADTGPAWARAPPLRALCQSPTHRGASLTFRYGCGSSLSCGGATGRSGRGSVSAACQGLCVPSFYGVPRACPLKRITRWAVNPGVGGARRRGRMERTRHSGPRTPGGLHGGPPERGAYRARAAGGGRTHSESRRRCSFSSSRCFSLYWRCTSASRIRKSSSMASMLSREDFMAYICGERRVSAGSHSRDATLTLTKTPRVHARDRKANPAGPCPGRGGPQAPLGQGQHLSCTHPLSPNPQTAAHGTHP